MVIRCILPIVLIVFSIKFILRSNSTDDYAYSWNYQVENTSEVVTTYYNDDGKFRGMSIFGLRSDLNHATNELIKNNIEWVAVIPYVHQKDEEAYEAYEMSVPTKNGHWSRRDSTFIISISILQDKGINVMLKPHLWVSSGWRSNLNLPSKTHWNNWFETYRNNMLHYAKMAEMCNVKLLCIGTELRSSIEQQPEQWIQLIKDIRSVYKGKLTYAANWDGEFELINFWNQLDFIGIQAYFPLTNGKSTDLNEIKAGWDAHIKTLEALNENYDKPILFTEIGYRSDVSATVRPWEWNSLSNLFFNKKSDQAQQLAYEAMFERLWHKDWFKGCFIWQWNTRSSKDRAQRSLDFSPRFKPAENTIAKWYKNVVFADSINSKTQR